MIKTLWMKIFLTLCFCLVSSFSFPQSPAKDFILLKRGSNQKTQIRFYPGEFLTYKSSKLGYFITDKIVNLDTEYIYLTENILRPADIEAIDIRNKDPRNRTLKNLTGLFIGGGSLLLSVESVNSLYQEGRLSVDGGVASISGILVATGLALLPVRYKTFRQKKDNRIQILIMRMD